MRAAREYIRGSALRSSVSFCSQLALPRAAVGARFSASPSSLLCLLCVLGFLRALCVDSFFSFTSFTPFHRSPQRFHFFLAQLAIEPFRQPFHCKGPQRHAFHFFYRVLLGKKQLPQRVSPGIM